MMALTQKGWLALKDKTVQVQANTHHTNAYTNTHTHTYTRTKDPRGISSVYFVVLVTKYTKTSSSRREGERTQCILHNQPCSHSVSLRNQGQNEKLNWEKGKHKRTLIYS